MCELFIDFCTSNASSFDTFLESIAASRGVTSLLSWNCPHDAMRRLVACLQNIPDFVSLVERLDFSSHWRFDFSAEELAEFSRLLRGFTRLTDFNLRGTSHQSSLTVSGSSYYQEEEDIAAAIVCELSITNAIASAIADHSRLTCLHLSSVTACDIVSEWIREWNWSGGRHSHSLLD
jgi:hypothetical protein